MNMVWTYAEPDHIRETMNIISDFKRHNSRLRKVGLGDQRAVHYFR